MFRAMLWTNVQLLVIALALVGGTSLASIAIILLFLANCFSATIAYSSEQRFLDSLEPKRKIKRDYYNEGDLF